MEPDKQQIKKELLDTLDEYFSRGVDQKKFIDVNRIPLICQDISTIHRTLEAINIKLDEKFVTKENYWPVKTIVYGAVGIVLSAVFTALVYLIVKKP